MSTTILAVIGTTALVLQATSRIPAALTDLVRALVPLRDALHDLRHGHAAVRAELSEHNPMEPTAPDGIRARQTDPSAS